jgi:hypothetical protein
MPNDKEGGEADGNNADLSFLHGRPALLQLCESSHQNGGFFFLSKTICENF